MFGDLAEKIFVMDIRFLSDGQVKVGIPVSITNCNADINRIN